MRRPWDGWPLGAHTFVKKYYYGITTVVESTPTNPRKAGVPLLDTVYEAKK